MHVNIIHIVKYISNCANQTKNCIFCGKPMPSAAFFARSVTIFRMGAVFLTPLRNAESSSTLPRRSYEGSLSFGSLVAGAGFEPAAFRL